MQISKLPVERTQEDAAMRDTVPSESKATSIENLRTTLSASFIRNSTLRAFSLWQFGLPKMCTLEKRGNIYILTLIDSGEHRLNPTLLSSLRAALSPLLSSSHPPNTALVTCAQGKFFSNGLDQSWARSAPPNQRHLMSSLLRGLVSDFLSIPMPTVCAVTGHVAAAGCALVLAHDYAVMRGDRGFFYMSELDAGLKFVKYFQVLFNEKIPDSQARRDVLLRSSKLTGRDAMERRIVDSVADGIEGTVEEAVGLAEEVAATVSNGVKLAEKRKLMLPQTWRHVTASSGAKL